MNLDDLKTPWQSMQQRLDTDRIDEFAARVGSKMNRFERAIRQRDTLESLVAVVMIVFFSFTMASSSDWATFVGSAILVLSMVLIIAVLNITRMYRPTSAGLSLAEHCKQEVAKVDRQIWLLRNVHWWYVGPMMVGCCVMSFGRGPLIGSITMCATFVAFGYFVYWLNQRAVKKELLPLRQELTSASETLIENIDNNQTGAIE